jgi:hypothetical protein
VAETERDGGRGHGGDSAAWRGGTRRGKGGAWRSGGWSAAGLTPGRNRGGDRVADGRTWSLARDQSWVAELDFITGAGSDASAGGGGAFDAKRLQASERGLGAGRSGASPSLSHIN